MKEKNTQPFDLVAKPKKVRLHWRIVEYLMSYALTFSSRHKLIKHNTKGLKPPYILLSTHGAFIDFAIAIKAQGAHRCHWVCSIEEYIGREDMFRSLGVIAKRKFTNDITMVRHVLYALTRNKKNVAIYPEARFSLVGVNEKIDGALGKLAKVAKVPVVLLVCHGNFLYSPQWAKHPYRRLPLVTDMYQIVTREEVEQLPAEEIQKRIEEKFVYDDYAWVRDNKIKVKSKKKAEGIHRVLYQCPHCLTESKMTSKDNRLWCEHCGVSYSMDEYHVLHCENAEAKFTHVPDWYRWEREQVRKQVETGTYWFEDEVFIEEFVNAKVGLVRHGVVKMVHDANGFVIDGEVLGQPFHFHKPVSSMYSCHIEFDFKGRGDCIDLATVNETWFIYPKNAKNVITKIHFATEELHNFQQK